MVGAYISVPFCAQKCAFCNFRSGVFPPHLLVEYLVALEAELAAADWTTLPDTLYVGGGTPSLLDPPALERILRLLPVRAWKEATIEASPGTVTAGRAEHWRGLGLDRVSLGVQSFVEREIRAAGRKHDAALVEAEVGLLRHAGLTKISMDLIAGLPYQTPESWRQSLEWIERLGPPHVSVYMFESDEGSRLGRELEQGGTRYGAPAAPEEGQVAAFYVEAAQRLERAGWRRYEISNFARPGFESLHNLKYWRQQQYRGFGADAHSFDGARRWGNVKTAAQYIERRRAGLSPVDEIEPVDERGRMEEHFFLGLRQTAGIEPAPDEWLQFADPIRRLSAEGLLARDGNRLRLTDRGILFSNEVFAEFLA